MVCTFLYSISIGPATWVYTCEVLPAKGVGLASTVNWLTTYLTAKMCPIMFDSFLTSGGVFYIYAIGTLGVLFFFRWRDVKTTTKNVDGDIFYIRAQGD